MLSPPSLSKAPSSSLARATSSSFGVRFPLAASAYLDALTKSGIAYQLVPDDPLIDNKQCTLDAKLMKELGTNSIRVYHVDPNAEHDDCMKTFADAGIYIWLDLDTFDTQIEQV